MCTTRQPAEAIAKKKVLDEQRCLLNTCKWAATWHKQQSDCAPSEDSDQPGHPPSLIRVFAVRMKKVWVLSYPLSAREDSDQTGWMPRLIWVFARRTVTLLVLSCRGSNYNLCEVLGLTTYLFYFIYLFILFFLFSHWCINWSFMRTQTASSKIDANKFLLAVLRLIHLMVVNFRVRILKPGFWSNSRSFLEINTLVDTSRDAIR